MPTELCLQSEKGVKQFLRSSSPALPLRARTWTAKTELHMFKPWYFSEDFDAPGHGPSRCLSNDNADKKWTSWKILYFIPPVFHDSQSQPWPQIWLQICPQQVLYWRLLNKCHGCSWHLADIKWQMATISTSYIEHFERETYVSILCFESC